MDITALRIRLRRAPLDFFSAVAAPTTLSAFDKEWSSLRDDIDKALQLSLVNDEDISLAHATAVQLATWSEHLLQIDDEVSKRTASFMDEMEDIFAQFTISDVDPVTRTSQSSSRHTHSSIGNAPSHISLAHTWLLQNIHSPYPSREVKERISRDTGRPLRVVTDWFKDARRHIGWVSVCKSHFKGSRALAVQAAKQVYLEAGPTFQLSSDIISQFEVIRTRLHDMQPLSDDNSDLSDSSEDSFAPSPASFRRLPSDQSVFARSRSPSSTPSLVFSSDDEDNRSLASFTQDDALVVLGKRKHATEDDLPQTLKRNRSGFIIVADTLGNDVSSTSSVASFVPSPQSASSRKRRISSAAADWEDAASDNSASSKLDSPPLRVLKRRLSVSDSQHTPKHPCLPPAIGPRKQAVSTPVPIAHQTTPALDEWFPFELSDTSSVDLFNWDEVIENDAFLYNSLFDNILQSDGQDLSNVTSPSDAYQSSARLDLGVSSAVDILDISSALTDPLPTQLTAPISTPPGPITATTTPVFDFLDAFLSAVNAESVELHTTQSSSSPSTELSLNDTIDLFGESVVMP